MATATVIIDGTNFSNNVNIIEITENFNVLDGENAGRSKTGYMIRDVIGSYVGHTVTWRNFKNNTAFDTLWTFLVQHSVNDSVMLQASDGQNTISYAAYYTSATRTLRTSMDGTNYWDTIQVNFIPIDAQYKP